MISQIAGGIALDVRVAPRSGRPGIAGTRGGALLVRLSAAPVDGAANAELIRILADTFERPRAAVTIAAGGKARTKRVIVKGVDLEEARDRLRDHL
jgi:uncharacterized protein (TIGR00251 family)